MVSEFIQNRCRHTHIILNDYSGLLGNIAFKREKKVKLSVHYKSKVLHAYIIILSKLLILGSP